MEAVVAPAGKLPWGAVSDAHGHMSGPFDLRGLRRAFCSLFRGHDLLTCSRAHRAVYTCVCVREWTQKMPWPGPEGLVSKGPFRESLSWGHQEVPV